MTQATVIWSLIISGLDGHPLQISGSVVSRKRLLSNTTTVVSK